MSTSDADQRIVVAVKQLMAGVSSYRLRSLANTYILARETGKNTEEYQVQLLDAILEAVHTRIKELSWVELSVLDVMRGT